MCLQFRDKDVVQDDVKCFSQVQAEDINQNVIQSVNQFCCSFGYKLFLTMHRQKISSLSDYIWKDSLKSSECTKE